MKVSIITAVFNRAHCIADAVGSVQMQKYSNVEHVVIDGASTDGTQDVLRRCLSPSSLLISERDSGIYDALNKGMARSSGEIIGVLHSDDIYKHDRVIAHVASAFADPRVDAVYGDLEYISRSGTRVVRYWRAGEFTPTSLTRGWMPPHPTLFLRRRVIDAWGGYDTRYKIAADYDAVLRYFGEARVRAVYLPEVLVRMKLGGESNRSPLSILRKSREDYLALRRSGMGGLSVLFFKNIRKLHQFFVTSRP